MPYKFKKGGIINETGAKEIPLTFNKVNLRNLLTEIINSSATFSHQDFANWCIAKHDYIIINDIPLSELEIDENTFAVLTEVDTEWDLYLVSSYKHEELQDLDLSTVKLPKEYFISWLKQLE
jgi:hypothetical protein